MSVPAAILEQFALDPAIHQVEKTGSGHINFTYLVKGPSSAWILQRINTKVFRKPEIIAANLRHAATHLANQYPDYLFLAAIPTITGSEMARDEQGEPWRLFPYIENTNTIDKVDTPDQAFEAAKGFAGLTRKLDDIDTALFQPTIPGFQDLGWRWRQLEEALANSTPERKQEAASAIRDALSFSFLVSDHERFTSGGLLKTRVVHNDTKINNILFDKTSGKAVCVIDLDTLMPGHFIYDLGDMVRTFVSPVSEEEKDVTRIAFRRPMYEALLEGYRSEMQDCLSPAEQQAIPFAGMMMTYIMAIRFLADFLNGNIYYQIHYPEQNLVRATNQLQLLTLLRDALPYPSID